MSTLLPRIGWFSQPGALCFFILVKSTFSRENKIWRTGKIYLRRYSHGDWLDNPSKKKIVSDLGKLCCCCCFDYLLFLMSLAVPRGSKQFLLWELVLGLRSARKTCFFHNRSDEIHRWLKSGSCLNSHLLCSWKVLVTHLSCHKCACRYRG